MSYSVYVNVITIDIFDNKRTKTGIGLVEEMHFRRMVKAAFIGGQLKLLRTDCKSFSHVTSTGKFEECGKHFTHFTFHISIILTATVHYPQIV